MPSTILYPTTFKFDCKFTPPLMYFQNKKGGVYDLSSAPYGSINGGQWTEITYHLTSYHFGHQSFFFKDNFIHLLVADLDEAGTYPKPIAILKIFNVSSNEAIPDFDDFDFLHIGGKLQ